MADKSNTHGSQPVEVQATLVSTGSFSVSLFAVSLFTVSLITVLLTRFWKRQIVDRFNMVTNCVGNAPLAIVLVGSGGCACFGAQFIAMHVTR